MCRNHQQEQAASTMFAWCAAAGIGCLLMAGAFHAGVKRQAYGEGRRCVDSAVKKGWLDSTGGVKMDTVRIYFGGRYE